MTRLTNAHNKKWENHEAMLALWFFWYSWCGEALDNQDDASRGGRPRGGTVVDGAIAAGVAPRSHHGHEHLI